MQLIRADVNFDFVGKRKLAVIISAILILISLATLLVHGGPKYGIDFAGGTLVQVKFEDSVQIADIKDVLKSIDMKNVVVQSFGDDAGEFLIRAPETSSKLEGLSKKVLTALETRFGKGKVDLRRTEMVGPQVGKELRQKGLMAIIYAMVGILIYVTWRFEFRYAVGAIAALIHDVVITLGIFSLVGKEIDLPIVAAFLAIVGYSLNDTIIVYDRIRENLGRYGRKGLMTVINRSINETLSRTIMTSGTTLLVVLALFVLGGGVIHNFAFAMIIGILIGTYSSIFVASALLLYWNEWRGAGSMEKQFEEDSV